LNNSLYPFAIGNYSLPSIFNIEFYGYTRGAYFSGKHEIEYNITLHMLMILLAGYINARCLRFRMGRESITVLVFSPSSSEIRDFLISRTKEERIPLQGLIEDEAVKQELPAICPTEALILWLLINLPEEVIKNVNLYLVAISEPKDYIILLLPNFPIHVITVISSRIPTKISNLQLASAQTKFKPFFHFFICYSYTS